MTTEDALAGLLPEWEALWRRVPDASPFLSPGWLWSWWRHLGGGALRVFTVRAGDGLAAVLPMFIWNDAGVRRLLPVGISVSDAFDLLADPAVLPAVRTLLAPALNGDGAGGSDWDRCELHEVPAHSPLLWLDGTGVRPLVQRQSVAPVLDLAQFAALKPRSAPVRKLHRAWRRARAVGPSRIEHVGPDAPPEVRRAAMEQLFALHTAQWQARGQPGVLAGSRVSAFHQDVAAAMQTHHALQLLRLHAGEKVAGVFYGFLNGSRAYAYAVGTDPALSHIGPGTILLGAAIEAARTAGARHFDFLRGPEPYKYDWGAVDQATVQVTLVPPPRPHPESRGDAGAPRHRAARAAGPVHPIDSAARSLLLASTRTDATWTA